MRIDSIHFKEQEALIKELNRRTEEYNKGKTTITDNEWDSMYFKLQSMEEENGVLCDDSPTQTIQYNITDEIKITHEHPMLSLPKTKSVDEVSNFIGDKQYIMMSKMDGLTCSLTYENGSLVRAETRGDGKIGENILHNALIIDSIPNPIGYKDRLVIDGEIVCRYDDFKYFEEDYSNPRNFAAGSIRLLDSLECAKRRLSFVAWDVIEGFEEIDDLYLLLRELEELDFLTTPYIFNSAQSIGEEIESIKEISKEESYPIDGVVVKYRSRSYRASLPATAHHMGGALAFKFMEDEYETRLTDIVYDISRNGEMTPVAVFEDVNTGDSILNKASLHNLSVMNNILGTPYINQPITIIKANDIIPQIVKGETGEGTIFAVPDTCPICGAPTEIRTSDSKVQTLYCSNENCPCRLINQIDHFIGKKGLDIKGLSKKTLEKLIDWGWINSIYDIYNLSSYRSEWIKKSGFGVASVDKILSAVEDSKNCNLENFIAGLGIPLIGSTASKKIIQHFKTYSDFRNAIKSSYDFSSIDSFGYEMSNSILTFDYSIADKVSEYMNFNIIEDNITKDILNNMTICITGKLKKYKNREELVSIIESNGGKVSSSVSSKTSLLINNDVNSTSSKNIKAKELNIPILTEEDFSEKYF